MNQPALASRARKRLRLKRRADAPPLSARAEMRERKWASQALLRKLGVPVNPWLPVIEPASAIRLRSSEAVMRRMFALAVVAGVAINPKTRKDARAYIEAQGIAHWFSAREQAFLFGKADRQAAANLSWRTECVYFLAWCAGMLDTLAIPRAGSDYEALPRVMQEAPDDFDALRAAVRLRGKGAILDWADLLFRLHWAVREADLRGDPPPPGVDGEVVMEWHRAVNWLIGHNGEDDWDCVSTDT